MASGGLSCAPPPPITTPGNRKFEHPETESDLVRIVQRARSLGVQVRVRGSLHSYSGAIFTDRGDEHINVMLDRYKQIIAFDDAKKQVTVQAGIHLGVDPQDPNSTKANSLLYRLEARGWALPDLGGITHQTVGGFLSTGSMGGTVHYDVGEAVTCIRIVAGDGRVYELHPNPDDPEDAKNNPFYAAGVSMGLLGIISTVTFQCVDRYDIIGQQVTVGFDRCAVDLFGDRNGGLRRFMEEKTYNRLLIWPQRSVRKVQLWEARRTVPTDAPTTNRDGRFVPKPYEEIPQALQGIVYHIYKDLNRQRPPYKPETAALMEQLINAFIPDATEPFWDRWVDGLPMDNKISDNYLPTEFTELFIDIARTPAVMRDLKNFWDHDDRMDRTGPYSTEVYPARASRFWLSPSYARNSVRIDVFWFKSGATNPDESFYPHYWELLQPHNLRFHWGKHLSSPKSSTGVAYRKQQCPMWDAFMKVRERFDPEQIFVNSYWRDHLGIAHV